MASSSSLGYKNYKNIPSLCVMVEDDFTPPMNLGCTLSQGFHQSVGINTYLCCCVLPRRAIWNRIIFPGINWRSYNPTAKSGHLRGMTESFVLRREKTLRNCADREGEKTNIKRRFKIISFWEVVTEPCDCEDGIHLPRNFGQECLASSQRKLQNDRTIRVFDIKVCRVHGSAHADWSVSLVLTMTWSLLLLLPRVACGKKSSHPKK